MEMRCPICGAPLGEGKCNYCGYSDGTTVQKSENINSTLEQKETGREQQVINHNTIVYNGGIIQGVSRKSKTVALLLCIFLGGLGIHRFYVGKVGTGILYLFTGGLFGVGWIIDIILVATGSFKDKFALPLQQ